jgi:hypothetical protein
VKNSCAVARKTWDQHKKERKIMTDGPRFSLPANLTFDEIRLAVSRKFGTHVKQEYHAGDISFCWLTLVAGNKLHDVTLSRNGEPETPFHNLIAFSIGDDPEASLDQFREIAHELGGTFYVIDDDGSELVLPYVEPDKSSVEYKRHAEFVEIIGRDAAATIRYVTQDAETRKRLIDLISL